MRILFITNDLNFKLGADIIAGFPPSDTITVLSLLTSGPQKETLEQLGVTVIEMNLLSKFSFSILRGKLWQKLFFVCSFFRTIQGVKKIIAEFKPDVVHTNLWLSDIVGIIAAKRCGIKKIVSTQHDSVSINFFARLLKIRLLKSVAAVIAISKNVADFTHHYFHVSKDTIKIIPNGIAFDFFTQCKKEDVGWEPVIGQIGRLEKIKGQFFLLKALKKLKESNGISLRTILIGSGSQEKKLKEYAAKNNLQVEFVPLTPDIRPWLKKMDILVVPSLKEGFGVVLLEGLAAEKLVIASNTGGIPEIIYNETNGLLIETPLDESIAKALLWSVQNKDAALQLQKNGSAWILQHKNTFSIETTASKYRELFVSIT